MNYAFIINPISGSFNQQGLVSKIKASAKKNNADYSIHYSNFAGHSKQIAQNLKTQSNTTIIAVGGDGTVNEIGSQLLHTDIPFGVVPTGSGNGLARHFKIPMQTEDALAVIFTGKTKKMDVGQLNGQTFFAACGVGFEAMVTKRFNKRTRRGLIGYIIEILKSFPTYNSTNYSLDYNEKNSTKEAFSLAVANSTQYGNNAIIAKDASVFDGQLDLCVIKKHSKLFTPYLGVLLLLNKIHYSNNYWSEKTNCLVINVLDKVKKTIDAHIDGETIQINLPAKVECQSKALTILIPKA